MSDHWRLLLSLSLSLRAGVLPWIPRMAVCSKKFAHSALPAAWPGRGERSLRQGFSKPPVLFHLQGELVTASKAIIEKEYQPHVIVSTTGPNPFNALTDRELEEYRREVERKQKGPEGECVHILGTQHGLPEAREAALPAPLCPGVDGE